MSKYQARAAMDQLVNRPVLVSPDYASRGLGTHSEVTSGGMMADLRELAEAVQADEITATKERNRVMASTYGFEVDGDDKPFAFSNGYALIPIHGLLINRFSWSWSFVTGYNFIRNMLTAAMADDDVKAIIFDVNSCGGMISGCTETADLMFEANASNGGKPMIAVVDANCHSAAYFLASQCDHIAVTPSGNCANIGVFRLHFDMSKMMDDIGVKATFIIAGSHKVDGNPFEPLSEDVIAEFQAEIDSMYDVFVAAVARGRDMDEQAVRDTEARAYGSADALALGLIDAVQNPSDAVEEYFAPCEDDAETDDTDDTEQPEPEESHMTVRPNNAAAAVAKPAAVDQTAEVTSVDTAAISSDARLAERTRIAAIQGHAEATDRPALAAHLALNTDLNVETATDILAKAAKETAPVVTEVAKPTEQSEFTRAMNTGQQPNVGAGGGNTEANGGDGTVTPAQGILAAQRRATGFVAPATTKH